MSLKYEPASEPLHMRDTSRIRRHPAPGPYSRPREDRVSMCVRERARERYIYRERV